MPTPEGRIEEHLLKKCKENKILCWKFTSPSLNGVPDRILMYDGQVIFVELKAPGEEPRPDQKAVHRMMQKQHVTVLVSDNNNTSDKIVQELLDHKFTPKQPKARRASTASRKKDIKK